jgi:hypothetical protein
MPLAGSEMGWTVKFMEKMVFGEMSGKVPSRSAHCAASGHWISCWKRQQMSGMKWWISWLMKTELTLKRMLRRE